MSLNRQDQSRDVQKFDSFVDASQIEVEEVEIGDAEDSILKELEIGMKGNKSGVRRKRRSIRPKRDESMKNEQFNKEWEKENFTMIKNISID